MDEFGSLLNALQHGDSFFPSGAVSFSWGLEAMAKSGRLTRAEDVQNFIIGQLRGRWACFDRSVVASAHRAAANLEAVVDIDQRVELMSPAAEMRLGSRRIGEAMLSVFARLGSPSAAWYGGRVKAGAAPGHIAPMQGLLWAEAGIKESAAVALSAHTLCTSLASASLRLGCLTHISAQQVLACARAEVARIVQQPMVRIEDICSFAIEAEIATMRHAAEDLRLFAN